MKGTTQFLLDISLISPDLTKRKELKLKASLVKSDSGYGNDTYLVINSRDGGSFEQCMDIRYDTSFRRDKAEVYIVSWAYSCWTGENGSWSIVGCSIRDVGIKKKLSKTHQGVQECQEVI